MLFLKKVSKKQYDMVLKSNIDEQFHSIFSSKDLISIDQLRIPPLINFDLASTFDTKFISTKPDIWEFFYSGNKIHLNFDCFDLYEKKILKFFLVSFVQVNTPSRLNSKLDSFKYTLKYFRNNKLNFTFDSFKILLNHLSKTDNNHFYYDLKFLVKLLFLENFFGFNIDKEYELDFLERPKSFNSELYYQEYEDRIDYPLKTMIHRGFSKINSDLLLHGENIANEQLLNSAMLALVYVSGLRPVQLAKLSVSDLKQDTIRKSDNFCRYSILIPYAKQARYVHEKIAIKLPEEIASILIAYIKRYNLHDDQKMFDMGDNASRFCQHSINKQLFEFSPKQYKEAVLSGEMIQQKYSYSDFRHHVGYSLAISGATAEEIAYILGHSSVVTARHYIFSTPEMAQIRAKALGSNSLYKQMIAMLLTGRLVYTKDWSRKKVLGNIGADIHYDIGGCSYPGHCLFQPVRNCYGCMYFHPFIDADHGKVLHSIQNEINSLIKLSDGIGLSRNPVIRIHETTKFEIESVILRCNVCKESDRDF
ncbi:hypothetical protein Asch01_03100 [Acinetobacter schindleri]